MEIKKLLLSTLALLCIAGATQLLGANDCQDKKTGDDCDMSYGKGKCQIFLGALKCRPSNTSSW